MKPILLVFTLVFSGMLSAQTVDVKDVSTKTGDEESTTIEIKRGKKADAKVENKWEIQDGVADLEGENGATNNEAKLSWTKACNNWKKEFRTDNKDNKILNLSCGTASC